MAIDPNITLAVVGIGLTLILFGLDKFFDLIETIGNYSLNPVLVSKSCLGIISLFVGIYLFQLIGAINSDYFLIIVSLIAIVFVSVLLFDIYHKIKIKREKMKKTSRKITNLNTFQLALYGIGAAFVIYGFDKLVDILNFFNLNPLMPIISRILTDLVGVSIFVFGIYILINLKKQK